MPIKIQLKGFDDVLSDIEAAGGSLTKACESAVKQSAQTLQAELKAEMQTSGVPSDLIDAMPQFETEVEENKVSARVGYKKGAYDPKNLSDGYKALFLNYGTPHRSKHGKVTALGFVERAKKAARPKIKKQQKEALNKILQRLSK